MPLRALRLAYLTTSTFDISILVEKDIMPLRALRLIFARLPIAGIPRVEKDIMPLRALRHCESEELGHFNSSGGERHHALAGIATGYQTEWYGDYFENVEKDIMPLRALRQILNPNDSLGDSLVEKDIMPLRALRLA